MRRTTLTAICFVGLALLAPATAATAVTETCRGEAATIVGTPGKPVLGTPGDDVIVSNRAGSVAAGDGDDLVCLSPTQDDEPGGMVVRVDAGAGDDVVVSEGAQNHSDT